MPLDRNLRTVFNDAARLYDEVRPGYPDSLFEDVVALSGIPPGGRILEVGCGPGKATLPFARRGYGMLCLELGPGLAALAAENCRPYPRVQVRCVAFEDWPLERAAFDLVVSAQAFHWVPPEIGYTRAAAALKATGAMALFWNYGTESEDPIFQALDQVYWDRAPQLIRADKADLAVEERVEATLRDFAASGCFGPVEVRRYPWSKRYTADEYVKLVQTYSDHRNLDEGTLRDLCAGVREAIEQHGGTVDRPYLAVLYVARVREEVEPCEDCSTSDVPIACAIAGRASRIAQHASRRNPMSDEMKPQPFDVLLHWILEEYEASRSIFGIPRSLFYTPRADAPYASELYGHHLTTPIGPAAGPHTQLAQNIVCAWLCGGRFIELKTVQIMDELEIPRPCIDLEDEGYNVEWSQELKLEQSASEYVKAWALIHVLRRVLGFEDTPWGTVFNMSVGYNLEGVQHPRMTRFMDRLQDPTEDLAEIQQTLRSQFPQLADLSMPNLPITNSVTLSTMHGCPPDEIERIARYLLEERGLHTVVKLNPTLLGQEAVMNVLHEHLGFREIHIPDRVFGHDLQYGRAVELIGNLKRVAAARGLVFGVKLSNTLAMANHKGTLPGDEMYMSGRALYPITMSLFHKLAREFDGNPSTGSGQALNVSYSAGADALNVTDVLAAGARPVTAASDLLKPGGYARLGHWLERLEAGMEVRGVGSLDELARDRLSNLGRAADEALRARRYKKSYNPHPLPKVPSGLGLFDCIDAPCVAQCAVCQDVPEYIGLIAQGEYDRALEVVLARNPLPGVTGHVCTHLCQTRCTRSASNYDEPVAIRALKRFAAERGKLVNRESGTGQLSQLPVYQSTNLPTTNPKQVAIIGSGPSGLAAAYFLALNGVRVTIYEAKDRAGGMLALAPGFRLPQSVVQADVDRTLRVGLGVELVLDHPITAPPEALLDQGFDAVYVACGFPRDARLALEGAEGKGVYAALDLLEQVARGETPDLGDRVLVVGGGNTAMDAARTARRLTGRPATVVYRRTRAEMPAEDEEIADLLAEGNHLEELVSPRRLILADGQVAALECVRNELGEPGPDGRRRPMPIPDSEFRIPANSVVVAIGQAPDVAFLDGSGVSLRPNGAIDVDPATGQAASRVYAGGDAARGPAIIVEACADGRRAAEAICARLGIRFAPPASRPATLSEGDVLNVKRARARKEARHEPAVLPADRRGDFDLVEQTLSETAARAEAARCLQCTTLCDKCVEVCPNRANYSYRVTPTSLMLPRLACRDGELVVACEEPFQVTQARQIVHVDDFCNECGNCATFCVHQGEPYRDKPRLFLREADFEAEDDNAFHVQREAIRRRKGGQEARLTLKDDEITYENPLVRLRLSPDFQVREMVLKETFTGTISLGGAAEMAVILQGTRDSLPFLLT